MSGKGFFLFFKVVVFVVEDIDFLLHDVPVEVHFFSDFFDDSLRVFGGFVLGLVVDSGEELVFFFEVVFFEGDFLKVLFERLDLVLFEVEPVGPFGFEGLEFEFFR